MARTNVDITTPDGICTATLHTPADTGAWPAVIMYPDAVGVRPAFAAMGDNLAALGYAVLVPDLYYRQEWAPFDATTVFGDPVERARLTALVDSLTEERQRVDTAAFLDFLTTRPEVADTPVGVTGYCLGGRMALNAAAHHPGRVGAAASFHGGNLAPADDPAGIHTVADRITATVYVAAADNDSSFPPDQHDRLANALAEANVDHTIETYPAAHGFAVPGNRTYDKAADERHWAALRTLYSHLT